MYKLQSNGRVSMPNNFTRSLINSGINKEMYMKVNDWIWEFLLWTVEFSCKRTKINLKKKEKINKYASPLALVTRSACKLKPHAPVTESAPVTVPLWRSVTKSGSWLDYKTARVRNRVTTIFFFFKWYASLHHSQCIQLASTQGSCRQFYNSRCRLYFKSM